MERYASTLCCWQNAQRSKQYSTTRRPALQYGSMRCLFRQEIEWQVSSKGRASPKTDSHFADGLLCTDCLANPARTHLTANNRLLTAGSRCTALASVCATCAQIPVGDADNCFSTDCPNLYSRMKADREVGDLEHLLANLSTTNSVVSDIEMYSTQ